MRQSFLIIQPKKRKWLPNWYSKKEVLFQVGNELLNKMKEEDLDTIDVTSDHFIRLSIAMIKLPIEMRIANTEAPIAIL